MQPLWDFLANNKDAVDTILKIFAFFGITSVAGILGWVIQRWWKQRIRIDVKVFEVITDPAILLSKLYATENDGSPLADHKIKYQPRDPKRDLQAELKATLNRSRYVLITAPTGYGKTREAGILAQTMMLEGWRVLRVKTGWLDAPKELPTELNNNRSRVLILLDDLNGLFSTGELTQSPKAEQITMYSQASYHDRLLQVLDTLESMCTENEILVIATARSEVDQWKVMNYNEKDRLWSRFTRIELPEPKDSAIIKLLEDGTKQAKLKAHSNDFYAIAHKSDGTYRNILLNLRRWQTQKKAVNVDDLTETLNGSWQDVYERAAQKHPASQYVYSAIFLLKQYQIPTYQFLVSPLARKISHKNMLARILNSQKINKSLKYLIQHENILSPRDGQIEACPVIQDIQPANHLKQILEVLILPGFFHSSQIGISIVQTITQAFATKKMTNRGYVSFLSVIALSLHFPFETISLYLYTKGRKENAIKLLKRRRAHNILTIGILSIIYSELGKKEEVISLLKQSISSSHHDSSILYSELGSSYKESNRFEEAEATYRAAIEFNPYDATAYFDLGSLLADLKRFKEAETAYRTAIELDASDAAAYSNLGGVLADLNRFEEAEAAYRTAIELDPSNAAAYFNLGILLQTLKRFEEAEAAYRTAIELNSSLTVAHSNLGILLKNLKRFEEAEAAYRTAIEVDPSNAAAYNNLGNLLDDLKRFEEAEAAYRTAIELNLSDTKAYFNLGLLLQTLKRFEEAEAAYRTAIELNLSDTKAYFNLGLLLKNLKRFEEAEAAYRTAIELNLSDTKAYFNLGNLLQTLKRFEEAEAAFRTAIEVDPSNAAAYSSLGGVLDDLKRFEEAEAAYRTAIELDASDAIAYFNLGLLLQTLKRFEEAETAYRTAIEVDPSNAAAYNNLGNLLDDLKRFEEAEAAYRTAIELNPDYANAYSNLGNLLDDLKRFEEAEAAYRKAIELNPDYANAYSNLGNTLKDLKRYDEAEAAYRTAIKLNPDYANAYNNLVILLRTTGKTEESIPLLEKLIEINPENFNSYLALASISKQAGKQVLKEHIDKANQFMPEGNWYNRACLESVCDNIDLAFEHLQKAAQMERFNPVWAWEDPDLQWLRDNPRFAEIVGSRPS